jgi:predicted dehydrogenase
MKQLLDAGEIGKPFLAVSTFIGNEFARMDDPANWKGTKEKSGGGVVIDNGTHMIDLLRWWLGEAVAVTARTGRLAISATNKEEDTAALAIEFAGGALAELSLTFSARFSAWPRNFCGAALRTEIFGLDGSIKVGNDGANLQYISRNTPLTVLDGAEVQSGMPDSPQAHFAACIRGESEPLVTVKDGLAALEIVEAAYESARSGQRVLIETIRNR